MRDWVSVLLNVTMGLLWDYFGEAAAILVPSRHLSQRNMKRKIDARKGTWEERRKVTLRFSSFLPFLHRELTKSFPLIDHSVNTERRLGMIVAKKTGSIFIRIQSHH